MMRKLVLGFLLLTGAQAADSQTFNPLLATMLEDTLDTYVAQIPNIKGMSAAVWVPGQGIWKDTAGLSFNGQPVTPDMEFGIASNTKLFVAVVMLKLAENNIFSLDDSLHEWLPALQNVDSNITIRQLLNHTSGISDPIFLSPWMDTIMANPTKTFTPNDVLSWLGAPLFLKGTSWGYSNVNYILAGMIAENATGFHISQLIRDSILIPLNLDSTFYDVEEPITTTIAHRWFNNVDFHDTSRVGLNSAGGCAGALFSTASEMVQWYDALMRGQVLNSASMSQLTTFVPTASVTLDYGLGIGRETVQGLTFWGHGGSTWGYKSKMIYDSCMNVVVAGLANSFPAGMDGVTFLLFRVLVNHLPTCAGMISGTDTVCQGQDSVTYTVPAIAKATSYSWTLPAGITGSSATNSIEVNFGLAAVSGSIEVRGTNNYGDGAASSFFVLVNPKPPVPVVTQNGNIIQSDAIAGNQWYDPTGAIPGANNQAFPPPTNGKYSVIVTLSGCSSDTSNVIDFVMIGTEDGLANTRVRVYPVPFGDELVVETRFEELDFEISNSTGQIVFRGSAAGKFRIETGKFSPGVYVIRFSDGRSKVLNKLSDWHLH